MLGAAVLQKASTVSTLPLLWQLCIRAVYQALKINMNYITAGSS